MNWITGKIMDEIIKFGFGSLMVSMSEFFTSIGNMGVEIFELSWIRALLQFFQYFSWSLFAVGLILAVFDLGIEAQGGRANLKDGALNILKGFLAVNLFIEIPIRLYALCVALQKELTAAMALSYTSDAINNLGELANKTLEVSDIFSGTTSLYSLFALIGMGYCVIKVFFASIKRGGILIIQLAIGSLEMFSLPRGYSDGFWSWCKQIVALCVTTLLQMVILSAGLLTMIQHPLLGLGVLMAASEVPRIAGRFGLDTSIKANITSTVYAAQSAVNLVRTVARPAA